MARWMQCTISGHEPTAFPRPPALGQWAYGQSDHVGRDGGSTGLSCMDFPSLRLTWPPLLRAQWVKSTEPLRWHYYLWDQPAAKQQIS